MAKPILEDLHVADSTDQNVYRLLGLIEERIGTIHDAVGDQPAAHEAFRHSLQIRERYAAMRPNDLDAVRDLAVAHEKMGLVAAASGDLEEARRRHGRATSIFRQLAEADSQNAQAWQSLAISRLHEGTLSVQGSHPTRVEIQAASSSYSEALELVQRIRRIDPANDRARELEEHVRARLAELDASVSQ